MAILGLLILLIINYNGFVFSQTLDFPSSELPPNIRCGTNFFECLAFFFDKALRVILTLAISLSAIFVAWAGILYIQKGSEKEVAEIHKKITWAVIGLVIALLSYAFIKFLEGVIRTPERIFLPIKTVFAQMSDKIIPPTVPTELRCGSVSLPSALERTNIVQDDVWKICLLYFLQKGLSALYRISLFLAVIFLSWAGVLYISGTQISSKGGAESDGGLKKIHQKIIYGVLGAIVSILSFTIVKMIDSFFFRMAR